MCGNLRLKICKSSGTGRCTHSPPTPIAMTSSKVDPCRTRVHLHFFFFPDWTYLRRSFCGPANFNKSTASLATRKAAQYSGFFTSEPVHLAAGRGGLDGDQLPLCGCEDSRANLDESITGRHREAGTSGNSRQIPFLRGGGPSGKRGLLFERGRQNWPSQRRDSACFAIRTTALASSFAQPPRKSAHLMKPISSDGAAIQRSRWAT